MARLPALAAAVLSGALLAASSHAAGGAPLQLVAFVPFFLALGRCHRASWAAVLGAALGIVRVAPYAAALGGLPPAAWVGAPVYILLLHASFGVGCFLVRRAPEPARALLYAALYAGIELVDAHLPMWGTALSLAAAWTPYPAAIRFVPITGPAGVAFVVVALQTLILAWARTKRWSTLAVVGILMAFVGGAAARPKRPPATPLRVAAIGWPSASGAREVDRLVAEAASSGARLVVFPEATFVTNVGERDVLLRELADLARRHDVYLAGGYIDSDRNENRVVFVDPHGVAIGEYTKSHLVPLAETTRAGDGRPVVVLVDGVNVGAVICQDDNFSDAATRYAKTGARVVVSPTFEISPRLGALHMRSARLRPVEGGFGFVRAAVGGTSAVISPDGVVLDAYDHLERGAGVAIADLP